MTQLVIWKYRWNRRTAVEGLEVPWTEDARVMLVLAQHAVDRLPTMWVQHELSQVDTAPRRKFALMPTGEPIDGSAFEFVGSAVCDGGLHVWHVVSPLMATVSRHG